MKQFTTPGLKETYAKLNLKVTKARKAVAYANIEAIKAKLDKEGLNAKAQRG